MLLNIAGIFWVLRQYLQRLIASLFISFLLLDLYLKVGGIWNCYLNNYKIKKMKSAKLLALDLLYFIGNHILSKIG
jgi:hypothetical protein